MTAHVAQEFTTVEVNAHPVRVRQAHRRWAAADYIPGAPEGGDHEPVAVTVVAPVALSLEDVAAVLFHFGADVEEEFDTDDVRLIVAEAVVNGGGLHLEEVRCRWGERSADTAGYAAYCRSKAAAVFGSVRTPSEGRPLAGVMA